MRSRVWGAWPRTCSSRRVMSERERALVHLAKGWEELLLACAEGLAGWRIRLESDDAGAPETGLEALMQLWSDLEARGSAELLPAIQ